jgi:hypothetical protein
MDEIPITFEHEGKEYTGSFDEVQGAGTSKVWYLMIDNYYKGRLRMTDRGWVFDPTPKTQSMAELANFFGDYITMWYG